MHCKIIAIRSKLYGEMENALITCKVKTLSTGGPMCLEIIIKLYFMKLIKILVSQLDRFFAVQAKYG